MLRMLGGYMLLTFSATALATAEPEVDATKAIASAMGVSAEKVAEALKMDAGCTPKEGSADLSALIAQAAMFAYTESFPGTGELADDFTRILVAQGAAASGCTALANLWEETDPLLRKAPEQGIGIAESDIAAAERLDKLGAPYWKEKPDLRARERVLAMWDNSDPDEQVYSRLFLTRLNAWAPAVEAAWDNLTDEERYLATRATFGGEIPDPEGQIKIVGHDDVPQWLWGGWMKSHKRDLSPYSDVLALAERGYFGGRYFIERDKTHRMVMSTMGQMMHSMVTLPTLFDMMDRSTESINSAQH